MAIYNLSNLTGADNFFELMVSIDQLSSGTFGIMFLISSMLIIYISQQARTNLDPKILLGTTVWAGILLSLMLAAVGFVNIQITMSLAAIGAILVLWIWGSRN